jgi:CheY-like chemotaxis protein
MPQDILIVEDVEPTLKILGLSVKLQLNIEPFLANDPIKAFNILQQYPIKVLVTDQFMPHMTGTELVSKMRKELNLNIPCILLTGNKNQMDIVEAANLRFFQFIDKDNTQAQLYDAIRHALQYYDSQILGSSGMSVNILISERKSLLKLNPVVRWKISRILSIAQSITKDDSWETFYIAEKGVARKERKSFTRNVKATFEHTVDETSGFKLELGLGKIIPQLQSSIAKYENEKKITTKVIYEEAVTINVEHEVEIKEITGEPNKEDEVLCSREYQAAPIYTRVNCLVEAECTFCQIPHRFAICIDLLTDYLSLRQIEHFQGGIKRIDYTGIINGGYLPNKG